MANNSKYFPLFIFIMISSCENPSSSDDLKLDEFEITYEKYGDWINPSKLVILNNGSARAKIISQDSHRLVDRGEIIINEKRKRFLIECVSIFNSYDSYYCPDHNMIDLNHNLIIVSKMNRIDTFSVYNLPGTEKVPEFIRTFINELEQIKREILRNEKILFRINSLS
jgi:hypothetical protein